MANSARTQPGAPGTEKPAVYTESNPMDGVVVFYEKNKKMINMVTTGILVVVVGYFAYTKLYKAPSEEKASTALSIPVNYYMADSLNMALNGDGKNPGFIKIAKKYSGTAAGNLAHYYMGVSYLRMGDFKTAIKELNDFDGKGTTVGHMASGVLGQAYMESGDNAKAIDAFKKATEDKEDAVVTPMYLYQMGLAYEASNNANEAKAAYKRIRDEYPKSTQARDIDKDLARLGEVN